LQDLKGFTFETGTPNLFGGLQRWTDKHSVSHYVDFLFDLRAGTEPQAIFDKYIKEGAVYPVNLNASPSARDRT